MVGEGAVHQLDLRGSPIQVVEADQSATFAATARPGGRYRRLVAAAPGWGDGEQSTYVLDVFRVVGGETHDYVLTPASTGAYDFAFGDNVVFGPENAMATTSGQSMALPICRF